MSKSIDIEDIKRVHLNPGDVLVIQVDKPISSATHKRIKELLHDVWPDNKAVVLDAGIDLEVVEAYE